MTTKTKTKTTPLTRKPPKPPPAEVDGWKRITHQSGDYSYKDLDNPEWKVGVSYTYGPVLEVTGEPCIPLTVAKALMDYQVRFDSFMAIQCMDWSIYQSDCEEQLAAIDQHAKEADPATGAILRKFKWILRAREHERKRQ